MAFEWFSCKAACSGSDPVSDTVKVDASLLSSDKENARPLQTLSKPEPAQKEQEPERQAQELLLQQQKEAEERRRAQDRARRRLEEEEAKRRREEKVAAERAAAERAAAEEAAAAEAAAAAKAKEEQLHLEAERAAKERARQDREAVERAALLRAQHREEERLAREKVNAWCKANGFDDMSSQKKSLMSGSRFALHEAVTKKDEWVIGLMVLLGADKGVKNSKGQTPEDLARKFNKDGSMDAILAKLS